MKIRDIITERTDASKVGNGKAAIAHTSKDASQAFADAEQGNAGSVDNVDELLQKVADMYGVEYVEDFLPLTKNPSGKRITDKEESLLTKDNRGK